ncbi:MAG: hypothetical protein LBU47_02640 [Christensenellaceae bacterium]|jgi:hypothetical protein|nr:hypothetical protein [Christensenellaceae bacterium]
MKKLLKYEFIAVGRQFLPVVGALLLVSLVSRALGQLPPEEFNPFFLVGRVLGYLLVAGVAVFALGITLQRFRGNLLGDEGYLMFTLPVSIDALIWSKLIVALLMCLLGLAAAGFSILLLSMRDIFDTLQYGFNALFEFLRSSGPEGVRMLLLAGLVPLSGILLCYMCMALAMLAGGKRGLVAVGLFFVAVTLLQVIAVALGSAMVRAGWFRGDLDHGPYFAALGWMVIGIELFFDAVFYFVTRFMLQKRLNLE